MKVTSLITVLLVALLGTAATAAPDGSGNKSGKETALGFISGKVTSDSGNPAAGVLAEAFTCSDGLPVASARADEKGDYTIGPLGDDCYHIRFGGDRYESTWIGEGGGYRETATEIDVAGNMVSGIDGSVTPAVSVITGKVKGPDGKPLPGAWVTALSQDEGGFNVSDGRTDKNGVYTVQANPGKHMVLFSRRGYVSKFYGSADKPAMVEVAEGKKASGIDMSLVRGGRIAGSVTDLGGNGIRGIYVIALGADDERRLAARTDRLGQFVLDGAPTGSYRVGFADPQKKYLSLWHDGAANPEEAVPVAVKAPDETSGIRGVLKPAGGISGRISDTSGNGIAGAMVTARMSGNPRQGGSAMTDETGAYTIAGLPSGSYLVSVIGSRDSYLPLFYRDAADESSASPVDVAAPQITYGIDQVIQAASLTGTVRNSSGAPISGVMVGVYRPGSEDSKMLGISSTGDEGAFSFSLPDGEYILDFTPREGGYLSQWSGGRATRQEASPVTVVRKEGLTKLEVVLATGGAISGTVRNRAGAPIGGVTISARDAATGEREESAKSDEAGKYLINRLRAGSYRLVADGSTAGYIKEKMPQAVEVRPPAVTENMDIVMSAGGAVSGKVNDREGNSIQGVTATAFDPATWDDIADATTDEAGAYSIGGLPEGKYSVRFEERSSRFAVQWYQGKTRREESALVTVVGTGATTGINATMFAGVPLKGTVTDTAGVPLAEAQVEVYGNTEDEPFDKVRTDPAGKFTIQSLAAGSYRVRFSHNSHVPRWYGGSDRRTAAPLAVGPGMAPIAVSLVKGTGRFSGKLTNPEGQQIGQAWITAIDAATGAAVADERICECSGRFNTPVPAASYLLKVERHGFVTWFGGNKKEEAVPIAVFGDVGGLDMVIEDGRVRSGRVAVKVENTQ